jgi:hypothetical protein
LHFSAVSLQLKHPAILDTVHACLPDLPADQLIHCQWMAMLFARQAAVQGLPTKDAAFTLCQRQFVRRFVLRVSCKTLLAIGTYL